MDVNDLNIRFSLRWISRRSVREVCRINFWRVSTRKIVRRRLRNAASNLPRQLGCNFGRQTIKNASLALRCAMGCTRKNSCISELGNIKSLEQHQNIQFEEFVLREFVIHVDFAQSLARDKQSNKIFALFLNKGRCRIKYIIQCISALALYKIALLCRKQLKIVYRIIKNWFDA